VHLFVAPQAPSVRGKLISHDYERDVALVSIRTPIGLERVQVAAPSYHPSVGEAVFSIGCDQGKEPSIREGRVNAINRYLGPANLVVSGRPTDGRSGGGLSNSDGQLLGVCYAADPQADEGLYAALPRIYTELDQNGLAFIYRRDDNVRATATPDGVSPEQVPGVIASATPLESSSAPTQRVPPPTVADWDQTEVVCIVRSKSDRASPSRVIVLDQPSTQFMEQLSRESGLARTASTTAVR
jgi:hypothetical protein